MKRKAKVVWDFLKHNRVSKFIQKYSKVFIVLLIVCIGILLFLLANVAKVSKWNWTAVGVIIALFALIVTIVSGVIQMYISNKNMTDNIQIRKAEFTNQFIKDFQKLMPEMDFCAFLYGKFNDYCDEPQIKELQKKLSEKDRFNYSIREYNNLKRELGIDDSVIEKARQEFQKRTQDIIDIAEDHYKEKGLSEFCSFHKLRNRCEAEKKKIYKDKDLRIIGKDVCEDKIRDIEKRYVNSIFVNIKNVVNELECNTLSVQFDLLDYDKITNLIYVPLHYYVSNLYIVMMENKIEHEKRNYYIYSNIKRLCSEVVRIKNRINVDMDLESSNSEKNKEQIITNATKTQKL